MWFEAGGTSPKSPMQSRRARRADESRVVLRGFLAAAPSTGSTTHDVTGSLSSSVPITIVKRRDAKDMPTSPSFESSSLRETALAHAIEDETDAAYRRGDALEKRRAMMEAWAQWCEPRARVRTSYR
jgi:hypothetical protein